MCAHARSRRCPPPAKHPKIDAFLRFRRAGRDRRVDRPCRLQLAAGRIGL